MCLEPFLEGGETVSVSDGGGELIPPLGGQQEKSLCWDVAGCSYVVAVIVNLCF